MYSMSFLYCQHTHAQVAQHHRWVAHMLAAPIQTKHQTLNHRHRSNRTNTKSMPPTIFSIRISIRSLQTVCQHCHATTPHTTP